MLLLLESTVHKEFVDPFGSTEIFRRETPDSDEKFLRSDHGIDLPGYSSRSHTMSYSSSYDGTNSMEDDDSEDLLRRWSDSDTSGDDEDDEEEFF